MNDWHWMHLASTLANHDFLRLETVLEANVVDVFSYLSYLSDKSYAERKQSDYELEISKNKK